MTYISALGYLGVRGNSLADWQDYGCNFLGLSAAASGPSHASFRMDERGHRLTVLAGDAPAQRGKAPDGRFERSQAPGGIAYFGWEVADAAALAALAGHLEQHKVPVFAGSRDLAEERGVADLILFADPLGNRLEAFHGAALAATPFAPGRNVSGFRCGALGMGHAVLTVTDIDAVLPFYRDVLGFGLSDYVLQPFKAYFLHVNGRHHSLALIESPRAGVHHLMMEMRELDDVGQAYDLALGIPGRIGTTLGRHTNDFMTSFYARTPSDFMIEVGWGGRVVDPATWQPFEVTAGPSLWGHDRDWLPAPVQQQARQMRLDAAAAGLRAPVQRVD